MKKKKIGLFGGTFDPIHFGHLNLAIELMEKRELEQVWFIPAQINPLKLQTPPVSFESRFAMVKCAIESLPRFCLKDLERHRPAPSFTIDTLRIFCSEEAQINCEFYLILGEDSVPDFFHWHESEEIIKLVRLLIGSRYGNPRPQMDNFSLSLKLAIEEGWTSTRCLDISATVIRNRLAQKLYCGHLVPWQVLRYIEENGIYTQTN